MTEPAFSILSSQMHCPAVFFVEPEPCFRMSLTPSSASQARIYQECGFASQAQNYWSRDRQRQSEWQGKLAGR